MYYFSSKLTGAANNPIVFDLEIETSIKNFQPAASDSELMATVGKGIIKRLH